MTNNINTIYVAMTRAALGMHIIAATPSVKCQDNLKDSNEEEWVPAFSDFSQILYWFLTVSGKINGVRSVKGDTFVRFDVGPFICRIEKIHIREV